MSDDPRSEHQPLGVDYVPEDWLNWTTYYNEANDCGPSHLKNCMRLPEENTKASFDFDMMWGCQMLVYAFTALLVPALFFRYCWVHTFKTREQRLVIGSGCSLWEALALVPSLLMIAVAWWLVTISTKNDEG